MERLLLGTHQLLVVLSGVGSDLRGRAGSHMLGHRLVVRLVELDGDLEALPLALGPVPRVLCSSAGKVEEGSRCV